MGPVSYTQPKQKPTSLLFRAADESTTYLDAQDIVARQRAFAAEQRKDQEQFARASAQPEKPAAQPEMVDVQRMAPTREELRILPRGQWAKQVHPEITKQKSISRRLDRELEQEYQTYVGNQLAIAQLGQAQQHIGIRREELEEQRERRKAQYPEGWRQSSGRRGQAEDMLAVAAIRELLAQGKSATEALHSLKMAGKTPPGATQLIEKVFGVGDWGGMLSSLKGKPTPKEPDRGPVAGWLRMYRELSAFLFVQPAYREAVHRILAEYAPTEQQLREALASGDLTPEQEALVQQILGRLEAMQPGAAPTTPARPGGFQPPPFMGE